MVSDANIRIVREMMDAYNDGDLSRWEAGFDPEVKGAINAMAVQGLDVMKMSNQQFLDAAPDQRAETSHWVASGDLVAFRAVYTGTMTGEYLGIPASGKRFEFVGQYTFRVADGKIVEGYSVVDFATFWSQIGLAP